MRTLVYLSSGTYREDYCSLPFSSMYFIDYNKTLKRSYPERSNRIRFIGKDALLAVDQLKKDNVQIDCLVVINEGLWEGGGYYPMFSDFLMGYLYPLLKDEFTLITDLKRYKNSFYKSLCKLDWAVETVSKLPPSHENYIDPCVFTTNATEEGAFGQVFKMRKVNLETIFETRNNQIKVKLIHGSIWSDAHDLDYIGLKLSNDAVRLARNHSENFQTSSDFFRSKPNVNNLLNTSFEGIINDAESKKASTVGLVPWGANNYTSVLPFLENYKAEHIKEIRFYHLNKNDFEELYKGYAD